ncbi:MAG: carbohydrate porin [Endomicrobium sp.]|nr:carbohydrate porin [Endomicrobium sp.]
MKRNVLVSVVVSLLLFLNVVSAQSSVSERFGIKTDVSGIVIMQGTPKANDGKNDALSSGSYLFDLKLIKEFENGKVVTHFKGGNGHGLELDGSGSNGVNTYGQVNANADPTFVGGIELAKVVELYYEQKVLILERELTVDFGKLNFWEFFSKNEFADDDSSQFLTGTFCGDKTIDSVPQHPAFRINYALNAKLDASYAYFMTDLNHIDANGINIVQAHFKPVIGGNYRLYVWGNNSMYYKFSDPNSQSSTYGFGISASQALNDDFGIFTRCGYKDHSVGGHERDENDNELHTFKLPLSVMWSVGAQIKGSKWSRENDVIGIAIGQIYGSSNAKGIIKEYNNGNYKDTAETQFELYYRFAINSHIALTSAFQYFANPRGGNVLTGVQNAGKNVLVYGIRTTFNF